MLLIDRTTVKTGKSGNSVAQAIELALGITAPASPAIKLNVSFDQSQKGIKAEKHR